jgi:signal transduction histidine kinase
MESGIYGQEKDDFPEESVQQVSEQEKVNAFITMAEKHLNSSLEKSLEYANQALEVAMELKDTILISRCYGKIGAIYFKVEMYQEALEYFMLENQLSQEIGYINGLEESFENMGSACYALNDTMLSLGFFREALAIATLQKDHGNMGHKHFNIAEVYYGRQSFDSALVYYNNSLDLFIQAEDTLNIIQVLQSISKIMQLQGAFQESRELLYRALKMASRQDMKYERAHIAYNVALSLEASGQKELAIDHLENALGICQEEGFLKLASDIYKELAKYAALTGAKKTALDYQKRAFTYEDSLRNYNQKNKLRFLEMKYDYEMQRNELNLLRINSNIQTASLERQKRIGFFTVLTLIIFFIALLISIRIFMNRRKMIRSLEEKQTQLEKTHRELLISEQNLKNLSDTKNKLFSILAHDLIHPFHNLLKHAARLNEGSQSQKKEMIIENSTIIYHTAQNIYQLLENLLQWSRCQSGKIMVKKESIHLNTLVDNVVSMVQMPADKKNIHIQTRLSVPDDVQADPGLVAAALRNLVQNAIKFTPENKSITITTRMEKEMGIIEVIDTGMGISKENQKKLFRTDMHFTTNGTANEKGAGLGLIIAKDFVEINGGCLKVFSEKGKGSIFAIEIPS